MECNSVTVKDVGIFLPVSCCIFVLTEQTNMLSILVSREMWG